jgi:hypothetical protein
MGGAARSAYQTKIRSGSGWRNSCYAAPLTLLPHIQNQVQAIR